MPLIELDTMEILRNIISRMPRLEPRTALLEPLLLPFMFTTLSLLTGFTVIQSQPNQGVFIQHQLLLFVVPGSAVDEGPKEC